MKKKSLIAVAVIAVLAIVGVLIARVAFAREAPAYRFATVERGNIESKVSATGTLNAVTTVSVGTQVSGQVSELLVDYNDHVKKGQLLARIDPTLAQQAVADAGANVSKAIAQEGQAQRDYKRNQELVNAGLIARSEYETTQSSLDVARANVRSAQVALDRAKQNLAYTSIYAPIDGVVVDRNVQQGQTVAASLSAPQLFLIANDLSHMQILAQVGESDIAQITQGQTVNFTVQALPNQKFHGTVQQVRLQSTTSDNVVNYTVVVAVDNPKGKLLPGMTARVDFLTNSATNVLKVSNAALRFHPSAQGQPRAAVLHGASLYYLDAKGQLQSIRVQTGITDGTTTEVRGTDLEEGMKVVAGSTSNTTQTAQQSSSTPFNSTSSQQRGGARPGGF
ncbi:MAG TPA: efflux RND transporter periplasmic adaptor subunit [Thermoanaerobaculia bacterium]|nr:efflux RND transporter periplasmic adaptor subunit [Thermoanaerobaculia bacterium]